ncbi:MAG TPA: phycobiliprotein lyase [Cyanobacteria bacterium UBA11149]|nr:phycobiliprotein lyase [Cyanobacteria bacterium UBA11367]HBE56820.1 phycobiliprotein lyase [Cyanobacteria bacterium UBA11366]HBK64230.1 phycobiliprotein lyase [Cyanobacteria bacterium UBA11166]HBR73308.1 phycobiliprotein lyase [Cyanobacteria bacterium UBA11159]HBS72176.1 phycobiliprotein lyase [Cyanobacteria bacterium UBA11153]HBW87821.1 phycobiliprotein lyase [Cyanobacteria bacterium UBA11149]HCA98018.1 phycobiliprotein lyase [Cyanobacteria bacterium UBA9226]
MDAMEFFQLSAGKWRSQRTTHHLAFKRVEAGESDIEVATLTAEDPQVVEICQLHQVNPDLAAGGALVRWLGTMAWDKSEGENHQGSSVMVIVPDPGNPRQGSLLRERGYAEIVPVAGRYLMDDENALILLTEYETMSSEERFSFISPDVRMRTSTVKRFGGFSTASLCVETRVASDPNSGNPQDITPQQAKEMLTARQSYSIFGF